MNHYCHQILCSLSSLGLANLVCLAKPQLASANNPIELQAFHIASPTIVPNSMFLGKFLFCLLSSIGR
jgi:hypothetical protein